MLTMQTHGFLPRFRPRNRVIPYVLLGWIDLRHKRLQGAYLSCLPGAVEPSSALPGLPPFSLCISGYFLDFEPNRTEPNPLNVGLGPPFIP